MVFFLCRVSAVALFGHFEKNRELGKCLLWAVTICLEDVEVEIEPSQFLAISRFQIARNSKARSRFEILMHNSIIEAHCSLVCWVILALTSSMLRILLNSSLRQRSDFQAYT